MNARIALLTLGTFAMLLIGCQQNGDDPPAPPEIVAAVVLEYNRTYEFNVPLKLRVRHPYAKANGEETTDFEAIAAPLAAGQTYKVTFVYDPNTPSTYPLLSVEDGVIYGAGSNVSLGGRQVGVYGDGTIIIVESTSSRDYVYLLEGAGVKHFGRQDENRTVVQGKDTTRTGKFRSVRYVNGQLEIGDETDIADDSGRQQMKEKVLEYAESAGVPWPQ